MQSLLYFSLKKLSRCKQSKQSVIIYSLQLPYEVAQQIKICVAQISIFTTQSAAQKKARISKKDFLQKMHPPKKVALPLL